MTGNHTTISDYCDVSSSKRIFAREYLSEGIPFWRGKEIVEKFKGKLDVSTELFISENRYDEIKSQSGVPKVGDILLTSVGTIGVPYLVKDTTPFYFKDGNITWFKPKENLHPAFLYYWLISPTGKRELSKCTIGAAQPAYTIVRLKQMSVDFPHLPTQERIASILSAYDDLIENNLRRIALLEQAARLLYREWFVYFRFPGHETASFVDGLPEGWEEKTLYDVVDVLSGGTPKTGNTAYWGDDIPFFTPKDTGDLPYVHDTEKMITEEGLKNCNSRLYEKDTLFITARGTVGKLRLAQRPMAMNQSCYALKSKTQLSQHFLFFAITERVNHLKGRAAGAVFDAIVVDTFKKIPMTIPTKEVADAFANVARSSLSQIDNLSALNRNLIKARDLLLPRLMDGRISVEV